MPVALRQTLVGSVMSQIVKTENHPNKKAIENDWEEGALQTPIGRFENFILIVRENMGYR